MRNKNGELILDLEEYLEEEEEQEEEFEEEEEDDTAGAEGDDPEAGAEGDDPEAEEVEEEPEPNLVDMITGGDLDAAREYIQQKSIDAVKQHIG